jgi:predicted ATPase
MIKRLFIDNYNSLVNFELHFTELTLLLGRNGTGKTSVLDVMYALRRLLSGEAKVTDPDIFPPSTLTRWQSRDTQSFEIDVVIDGSLVEYKLEVQHDRRANRARIGSETLTTEARSLFSFKNGEVRLFRDDFSDGPTFGSDWTESALARVQPRHDNARLSQFLDHMRKVIVCGLYPASFVAESSAEDPMLRRDASNFAAWYRHLLLERQELVQEFTESIRPVIDEFRSIRMEKVGLDTRALICMFEHKSSPYELRISEISDGQRALIALYALIKLTKEQGYTLFLDEPENYIALAEIQPWLMELSDACGITLPQTVICSHHPELIDYLGTRSGVLLSRKQGGAITARPASEVQNDSGLRLSEIFARGHEE